MFTYKRTQVIGDKFDDKRTVIYDILKGNVKIGTIRSIKYLDQPSMFMIFDQKGESLVVAAQGHNYAYTSTLKEAKILIENYIQWEE